jgi:hypothetical protein
MKHLTPDQLNRLAMNLPAWQTAIDRLIQRIEVEHHDEEEAFKRDMKRGLRLAKYERTAERA